MSWLHGGRVTEGKQWTNLPLREEKEQRLFQVWVESCERLVRRGAMFEGREDE
jgi:hypothetical protein